jgi:putative transcriptional regulator
MTVRHHPDITTLGGFAFGSLDKGRSVVVAAHVKGCAKCQSLVRGYEEAGGALLEGADAVPLSAAAPDRMLAAVLQEQQRPGTGSVVRRPDVQLDLSTVLATYREGPWRWLGPGVHYRSLSRASPGEARVFLLKSAPGTSLPEHTHTGTELTLVLCGAYAHAGGRFGPGDLEEADSEVEHQPVVEEGKTCICLVAMEGKLQLKGLLGRVMQPFVRL